MVDVNKIMQQARVLAEVEKSVQCPTLLKFAVEKGITLKELRDELRVLFSMSDEEAEEISRKML